LRRLIISLVIPFAAALAVFLPAVAHAQAPHVQWDAVNPIVMSINGEPYTVTLALTNNSTQDAISGQIDVTLPAGVTLVAPPAGCTVIAGGFSCQLAVLPPLTVSAMDKHATKSVSFDITASAPVNGSITGAISGVAAHGGGANQQQTSYTPLSVSLTATAAPDLKSTILGNTPLTVGVPELYTVTVVNQGNEPSTDGTVTIRLPLDVSVDATTLLPYCTLSTSATNNVVTCDPLPGIDPGDELQIPLTLTATAVLTTESVEVVITDVDGEIDTRNNTSTTELSAIAAPHPDLTSSIIGGTPDLTVGEPQTYKVTVTNIGDLDSADGTLTITLGSHMTGTLAATLPANVSCSPATGMVFTCTLGTIAANNGSVTIPVEVTATDVFPSEIITADITGVTGEEIEDNNSSESVPIRALLPPPLPAAGSVGQAVPTLNETALVLLALLLAGGAAVRARRKQ